MKVICPTGCSTRSDSGRVVRFGSYYRTSDKRHIQRFRCTRCFKYFSQATGRPEFLQKKRQLNFKIERLYASGVSQRRISRLLKIHHVTVARKVTFLGNQARLHNLKKRIAHNEIIFLQFDELETFEHTKLKPLSVVLAVEKRTRYILGAEVAKMPANGLLSKRSLKKYGPRKDERNEARDRLFRRVGQKIFPHALIESDENPHYPRVVKTFFPKAIHLTHKGQRGAITGQGELKKVFYDPLFSLNHTCAMLRANVNRLFRKTWCTTKKMQPLIDHLEIYIKYHNDILIRYPTTKPKRHPLDQDHPISA